MLSDELRALGRSLGQKWGNLFTSLCHLRLAPQVMKETRPLSGVASRDFLATNAAQVTDGRLHASLQGEDHGRINDHPDIRRVFEGFHM